MSARIKVSKDTKDMLEKLRESDESLEDVILSLGMEDFDDEDEVDEDE